MILNQFVQNLLPTEPCPEPKEIHISALYFAREPLYEFRSSYLYEKVKHLSSTAKVFHKYEFIHDQVGFNYRMNNLNSSFGVGQIIKIRKFINNKRNLFKKYNENFRKIEGCKIFKEPKGAKSNYWLQTLFIKNLKSLNERNKIIEYLISKNINVRPVWKLTSKLKPYKNCPADNLENAKEMERTAISLPSSSFL